MRSEFFFLAGVCHCEIFRDVVVNYRIDRDAFNAQIGVHPDVDGLLNDVIEAGGFRLGIRGVHFHAERVAGNVNANRCGRQDNLEVGRSTAGQRVADVAFQGVVRGQRWRCAGDENVGLLTDTFHFAELQTGWDGHVERRLEGIFSVIGNRYFDDDEFLGAEQEFVDGPVIKM